MSRFLFALVALGAAAPAFAWDHLGHVWAYDEMPIPYYVSTPPENSYSGFNVQELALAQQFGYGAWAEGAPCAEFRAELAEILPEEDNIGYTRDGRNLISFDDPDNDLTETGTLAAALTWPNRSEIERFVQGVPYWKAFDSDIIYNNDVSYTTNAEIDAGNCGGAISIEAVATHEIGHVIGLAHSCEREEICNDASKLQATMYWQAASCDTSVSVINSDDIDGINALYGPFASFECSHELDPTADDTIAFGVVPFELKCAVASETPEEITNITWSWGDGTVTNDRDGTHVYETTGNYTVNVCFEGQREGCGDWEFCFRRAGYVRACDVPNARFTYEGVEGLTYRLLNETDITVYGCIFDIEWQIWPGTEPSGEPLITQKAWEPEITFDEAGTYTAILNVGGPAGTGAARLTFDVVNVGARGGCNQGPQSALGGLVLLGLAFRSRRRRD